MNRPPQNLISPFRTCKIAFLLFVFSSCIIPVQGQRKDSLITVAAGEHYQKSSFHQFWWGKHYREIWAVPVSVPLLWVSQFEGGIKPLQEGGSFQTKNLRLVDKQGHEYVLRSIDKDPSKALPVKIRKTFVANIMRDQTSVIHPYGAFLIPPLAEAADIYHTNPKLVVIADDPALGEYRNDFAGMLALIEERPDGNWEDLSSFGNSKEIISSRKAFDKLFDKPNYQVDAVQYLKSRLFDIWLGDWSRREDQWRWGVKDQGKNHILEPIPRDRDHAFFLFDDGVFTKIVSLFKPNYQSFDKHITNKDVTGLTKASRQMDAYLLASLTQEDFMQTASELQQKLTDDVITKALQKWPPQISALSEKQFYDKLSSRREDLPKAAKAFYQLISKHVLLPGTDEADTFHLQFQENGNLVVHRSTLKDSERQKPTYSRTFKPQQTKSITFYGLGSEDNIEITGKGKNLYKIKWLGGEASDKLIIPEKWEVTGKQPLILNERDGNDYKERKGKIRIREYEPKANEFNAKGWLLRHRLHD